MPIIHLILLLLAWMMGIMASIPATPTPTPTPTPAPAVGLIWPAHGPISSYMDATHPLGIDINLANNTPILAATSGYITVAGGDPCCSYGLHVVLISQGGIKTIYGHLSSVNVVYGQQVVQGNVIGYAGCTGNCGGTHLHLEVIDGGVRQNPLNYLP